MTKTVTTIEDEMPEDSRREGVAGSGVGVEGGGGLPRPECARGRAIAEARLGVALGCASLALVLELIRIGRLAREGQA